MNSFANGERQITTAKHCQLAWGGGEKGKYFRCGLCGYKFVEGDGWRFLYTNDIPGAGGNPLVCDNCFVTKEEARKQWVLMVAQFKSMKTKYWYFFKQYANKCYYENQEYT